MTFTITIAFSCEYSTFTKPELKNILYDISYGTEEEVAFLEFHHMYEDLCPPV
jgi:hypothetical protein